MGNSYNGYTWQQRAKIIPAFRRASGRPAPFVGQPCNVCGDPDRAEGEWHSEDYSEPFTFAPPASYPVCKTCHGRLHKRFNAIAGEWELFCHHLDAGGYGREFVQLYSRKDRMEKCNQLAAGKKMEVPLIRARIVDDSWWRSLTLDQESLNASWARPRPLRSRPAADVLSNVFLSLGLKDTDIATLRLHAGANRRTITMRDIAKGVWGKDAPGIANLAYGRLARRIAEMSSWETDHRQDGSPVWMSVIGEGWYPPDREYEWTMAPSVAEAVAQLPTI